MTSATAERARDAPRGTRKGRIGRRTLLATAALVLAVPAFRVLTFLAWTHGLGGEAWIVEDLNANGVVREHLGRVTACRVDWAASREGAAFRRPAPLVALGGRVVFAVEGASGVGHVEVADASFWTRTVRRGWLYVGDDTVVPLSRSSAPRPDDGAQEPRGD